MSLYHKLKFSNPFIFTTWWCKALIFQTYIIRSNRIYSLTYLRSTTLGCIATIRDYTVSVCGKNKIFFCKFLSFISKLLKQPLKKILKNFLKTHPWAITSVFPMYNIYIVYSDQMSSLNIEQEDQNLPNPTINCLIVIRESLQGGGVRLWLKWGGGSFFSWKLVNIEPEMIDI